MHRRQRLIPGLVVLSLLILNLCLAACGGDNPTPPPANPNPPAQPQITTATLTTTQAATAAPTTLSQITIAATTAAPTTGGVETGVVPRFEPATCPFLLGKGQTDGQNIKCGYLVTAQEHAKPQDKTIRLAVAILKSTGDKPAAEPLVYLEGGPGGPVENTLRAFSDDVTIERFPAKALLKDHTMIFIDQRGVGYSLPTLDCRENNELIYADLTHDLDLKDKDAKDEDLSKRDTAALRQCRDRLIAEGNNLSDFNSAENAADINDLRTALGYNKIDLFGVSYGTRLALTVMRDYGQGLRSVILDSTVPLQVDLYAQDPANYDRVLNLMFKACGAEAACNRAYPNLKAIFSRDVAKLNAEPALVPVREPRTGKLYGLYVSGKSLVNSLFQVFYDNELTQGIPLVLGGIDKDNFDKLSQLLSYTIFGEDNLSDGMYYSVQCSEATPFSSPEAIAANARNLLPEIRDIFVPSEQRIFKTCQDWPVKAAPPVEGQPVTSDIPTLVMSGEYDPITPPAYGQLAAKTLSKSFWLQFPGIGHGVVFSSGCGTSVAQAFLQNPTAKPDASCTATMSMKFIVK